MVGWPSEVNTARSVIPCTVDSTDLILLAVSLSACRSLPYNLIEFSPFTPETASETLSCKYCEKLNSTPGNLSCSCPSNCAVSSSLSCVPGHSLTGFNGAKNSALNKHAASVPSSGRPCCDTTASTLGSNSSPNRRPQTMVITTSPAAAAITRFRLATAQFNTGT